MRAAIPMNHSTDGAAAPSRPRLPRAAGVWCAFAAASLLAVGVLAAIGPDRDRNPAAVRLEAAGPEEALGSLAAASASGRSNFAPRDAPVARGRWRAIVVHDSGSPAGDLSSLERRHARAGLAGLGFHFVIGNGQGMDDGLTVAGFRWDRQLPGAHALRGMELVAADGVRADADALNRCAISVCLVGNVGRRAPTDAQLRSLETLVRSLQAEFGIPPGAVRFRSELGAMGGAAGAFPLDRFRSTLLQ